MISVYEAPQGKSDDLLKEDECRSESGVICCKNCHAPWQTILICVNDQNIRGTNRARALERGRGMLLRGSI